MAASWGILEHFGCLGASSGHLRGVSGRLGSVVGRLGGILGASWGRLGTLLGRLGRVLGASWGVLGGKTVLESSWSRFGAVLEASWRRLGDVLGRLGSVLGASCGPLRGFLGRLVGLLEHLGAFRRYLVRDFPTKRWLHVSPASEIPFLNRFLLISCSSFDLQNYVKYDSRLRECMQI